MPLSIFFCCSTCTVSCILPMLSIKLDFDYFNNESLGNFSNQNILYFCRYYFFRQSPSIKKSVAKFAKGNFVTVSIVRNPSTLVNQTLRLASVCFTYRVDIRFYSDRKYYFIYSIKHYFVK